MFPNLKLKPNLSSEHEENIFQEQWRDFIWLWGETSPRWLLHPPAAALNGDTMFHPSFRDQKHPIILLSSCLWWDCPDTGSGMKGASCWFHHHRTCLRSDVCRIQPRYKNTRSRKDDHQMLFNKHLDWKRIHGVPCCFQGDFLGVPDQQISSLQ